MRGSIVTALVAVLAIGCGDDGGTSGTDANTNGTDASAEDCTDTLICSSFRNTNASATINLSMDSDGTTVVVAVNGIPEHATGFGEEFYGKNPNSIQAQSETFYIPANYYTDPALTTNKTPTSVGTMAISYNGVSLFSPSDARIIGGCTGNAGFLERGHTDDFGGHPEMTGQYHYHSGQHLEKMSMLAVANSSDGHSPIVGWSFDGYPIYGPYGYSDTDDTGSAVELLHSCYSLKAARDCCTAGACTTTDTLNIGCPSGAGCMDVRTLTLGAFAEDYEHVATGSCHLDQYNMRYAKTPESPDRKMWFYVMTIDPTTDDAVAGPTDTWYIPDTDAEFPFIVGMNYAGAVDMRNL